MDFYLFKRKVKGKKKGSKLVYYAGFLSESPGKKYESIKSTKTANKILARKVAEKGPHLSGSSPQLSIRLLES